MVDVSVIIPVHNCEKTLGKCIQSLMEQTYRCKEIILVDNGSSDRTWSICANLSRKYDNIFSYKVPNGGVSVARNYGLSKSSGELISFVDGDDMVHKKFVEELCRLMGNGNDLACCGYIEIADGKIAYRMKRKASNDKYLELIQNYQGFLTNKLYRAKIIKTFGIRFDEDISMSEDLLFNFEYLKRCTKIGYSDHNYYYYYVSGNAASRAFRKGWFDILAVFNRISGGSFDMTEAARDNLNKQYLFILGEARMRCRIMGESFKKVCREYGITPTSYKYQYRLVMQSKNILLRDKIKLFVFTRMNFFAQIIKFRRWK